MDISRTAPPLSGPVVAAEEWRDAAFVHWRVAPEIVAPLLPAAVVPDVFDGWSLEAASLPAVLAARALFSLPYIWARTAQRRRTRGWAYASRRIVASPTAQGAGYQLAVDVDGARTVDHELSLFLTARWGLFQTRLGRTVWLPNEHEPWVLHPAAVTFLRDELCDAAGLPGISSRPPAVRRDRRRAETPPDRCADRDRAHRRRRVRRSSSP